MKKTLFLRAWLCAALCVSSASFASSITEPLMKNHGTYLAEFSSATLQHLMGHVPVEVLDAREVSEMSEENQIDFAISLKLNHEEELEQLLKDLYDPSHPRFGKFLTVGQFAKRFSPSKRQVEEVITHLQSYGMSVKGVDENRLLVHVSAHPHAINQAFHTRLMSYGYFYAPAFELKVKAGLPILGVHGLDNVNLLSHSSIAEQRALPPLQGTGPNKGFAPKDYRKAYTLPEYYGRGEVVGLFQLDGYRDSDIKEYKRFFNLPAGGSIENILIGNQTGEPGLNSHEVTMDIELILALAPKSTILVYMGVNGGGIIPTFNRIASDNRARTISTSWGAGEGHTLSSFLSAENQIFKQMAAQGQSMFAASGDTGPYNTRATEIMPSDPASQPFVTGVGATQLIVNPDMSWKSETTWNVNGKPLYGVSGGGKSTIWSQPDYQLGAVSPESLGSTTMRNVPDVSANGAINTGVANYYNGKWMVTGGTSCSAPLWAAFMALANQSRKLAGLQPIGFYNPSLYQMGKTPVYPLAFHDIADLSNNIMYPAVTGYDLATGFGTFSGRLIKELTKAP